jgi:hypothetical protein
VVVIGLLALLMISTVYPSDIVVKRQMDIHKKSCILFLMTTSHRKSVPILLRVLPEEREGFQQAAELTGVNLTTWIRTRLRVVASDELKKAGVHVAFVKRAKTE